jgi:hypothetical protein
MSRITLLVISSLLLDCSVPCTFADSRVSSKRIHLRTYGFSLQPPTGWHTALDKDDLPIFVNFPWSKMQAQLRLPAGGAVINLVAWAKLPRRRGDESLIGWSHLDDVRAAPGTVVSDSLHFPASTETSDALLVSFNEATFGPDDQPQREVSVYWTFRREKFGAHLFYLVGDPHGMAYEAILHQIVASIRPL